jgi:hypothetical protein
LQKASVQKATIFEGFETQPGLVACPVAALSGAKHVLSPLMGTEKYWYEDEKKRPVGRRVSERK